MAENPLLPNAELRSLLDLTRRCANLDAAAARRAAKQPLKRGIRLSPRTYREALLAGSTLQLRPDDLLVADPMDATAASLAPNRDEADVLPVVPDVGLGASGLLLSVAMAAALKATGTDHLVLHTVRAGTPQTSWAEALAWAQQRLLPLILVCADARGSQAFLPESAEKRDVLAWTGVRRTAAKLQLPVLTVDGEDAVAVYRVMQESVLRARAGGGPSVLWAMLPAPKDLQKVRARAQTPVARLERYLRARKISF